MPRPHVGLDQVASADDVWLESDHLQDPVTDIEESLVDLTDENSPRTPPSPLEPCERQPLTTVRDSPQRTSGSHATSSIEVHTPPADDTPPEDTVAQSPEIQTGHSSYRTSDIEFTDEWPYDSEDQVTDDGFAEFTMEGSVLDPPDTEAVDFEPDAHQLPWERTSEDDEDAINVILAARQKAAHIVPLLSISYQYEKQVALELLTEFFQVRRHGATFHAIKRATKLGLSLDLLQSMIALREVIEERPEFWVGRYGPRRTVARLRQGATAFSWVLVRHICIHFPDLPPDMMVGDDWLDAWHTLLPGDIGYLSFPQYLFHRIEHYREYALRDGLSILYSDNISTITRTPMGFPPLLNGRPSN